MDLLTIVRVVVRRWMVVVPVLLLTMAAVFFVHRSAAPVFEASGSAMLAGPVAATTTEDASTSEVGESAVVTPAILAELARGLRGELAADGADAEYEVEPQGDSSIITVTARGDDPDPLAPTVEAVLQGIADAAVERQADADVPESSRIGVDVLTPPSDPVTETYTDPAGEVATRYTTSGSVVLVAPVHSGNAYTPSQFTTKVVEQVANSHAGHQAVADLGGTADYEVGLDPRERYPILFITATGTDPEAVVATFHAVVEAMNDDLSARQEAAGVVEASRVSVSPLAAPESAVQAAGNRMRPLIVMLGLGLIAAVGLALLVESTLGARRRRPLGQAEIDDFWTDDVDAAAFGFDSAADGARDRVPVPDEQDAGRPVR